MNNQHTLIKEKLASPEYNFLSKIPNIIILTLGGSHAYGTSTPTSDIDIRGIAVNSAHEILTMNCKDKPIVNTQTDTTIYFLKQIVSLLSACNPNTIEILGTRIEDNFILTPQGQLLRDNIHLFLSQRAIHSFGGYATAQLRRLQNALARDNYPQSEKENHILQSIQGQNQHIQANYASFNEHDIKLYLDTSHKFEFEKEIYIDINLNHYPLRDLKSMYSDMANVIKDYDSLNHRNNKKDNLHLQKHAMHLIRLLMMGTEILEGKGVHTYRQDNLDLLMKIRNGYYVKPNNDYSDVFSIVDEYEQKFNYAKQNTSLPKEPDYTAIDELVIEINKTIIE